MSFFLLTKVYRFFWGVKKLFSKNVGKKFQSALSKPLGRSTGNNFSLKGGPIILAEGTADTEGRCYRLEYGGSGHLLFFVSYVPGCNYFLLFDMYRRYIRFKRKHLFSKRWKKKSQSHLMGRRQETFLYSKLASGTGNVMRF